jgi:hypothetical protein
MAAAPRSGLPPAIPFGRHDDRASTNPRHQLGASCDTALEFLHSAGCSSQASNETHPV